MSEPIFQFWRTIKPVVGQEIPKYAQAYAGIWVNARVVRMNCMTFLESDLTCEWRVPVEAVPLDVAVDAVLKNAEFRCGGYVGSGQRSGWRLRLGAAQLFSESTEELRELVTTKLREMSGESN